MGAALSRPGLGPLSLPLQAELAHVAEALVSHRHVGHDERVAALGHSILAMPGPVLGFLPGGGAEPTAHEAKSLHRGGGPAVELAEELGFQLLRAFLRPADLPPGGQHLREQRALRQVVVRVRPERLGCAELARPSSVLSVVFVWGGKSDWGIGVNRKAYLPRARVPIRAPGVPASAPLEGRADREKPVHVSALHPSAPRASEVEVPADFTFPRGLRRVHPGPGVGCGVIGGGGGGGVVSGGGVDSGGSGRAPPERLRKRAGQRNRASGRGGVRTPTGGRGRLPLTTRWRPGGPIPPRGRRHLLNDGLCFFFFFFFFFFCRPPNVHSPYCLSPFR
ncbi:hypothetical protein DIPPA_25174 [Diplonema papillatum]|nr:hypothetical protein DIPPA_25174 [Diplonema papillatum]